MTTGETGFGDARPFGADSGALGAVSNSRVGGRVRPRPPVGL